MNFITKDSSMMHDKKVQLTLLQKLNVYYNDQSVANILCIAHVAGACRVTMHSVKESTIVVHLNDTDAIKFQHYGKAAFYFDNNASVDKYKHKIACYSFFFFSS